MRDGKVMKVTGTQGRSKEKPGHYLRMGRRGAGRSRRWRGKIATCRGGHPSNRIPEKQQGDMSGKGASAWKRA